jgi:hypothetical protein
MLCPYHISTDFDLWFQFQSQFEAPNTAQYPLGPKSSQLSSYYLARERPIPHTLEYLQEKKGIKEVKICKAVQPHLFTCM